MIIRNLFLLLALAGIFCIFPVSSYSQNEQDSVGVLPKIVPVVDKQYFPSVLKLIQEAKTSISISMFVVKSGMKVDTLVKELKNAANRGVKVAILVENDIETNEFIVNSLNPIKNIDIKFDSPRKTTHNKIIIIDESITLIGSTNWTESSLGYANEANVIINDLEIAEYFQKYFNYLWENSSKDISPFKVFKGEIIPIIDRQYFDIVNERMQKATNRIFVMVYGFKLTSQGMSKGDILADEIIKAKNRGVQTKVLLEKSSFNKQLNNMNAMTIEYFKARGVEARFDSKDIITHSKVVIIDDAVILGATNWSYSGLDKWHNTDIMIKEKSIVEYFVNYFEEKFSNGR